MNLRVEKIPKDQIATPQKELVSVSFAHIEVIESYKRQLILTRYYGSTFLFRTIPGEPFSETKKRILNFIGYGKTMNISMDEFTFNLNLRNKFDISEKFPLINDDQCLSNLVHLSSDIVLMFKHPPELKKSDN